MHYLRKLLRIAEYVLGLAEESITFKNDIYRMIYTYKNDMSASIFQLKDLIGFAKIESSKTTYYFYCYTCKIYLHHFS